MQKDQNTSYSNVWDKQIVWLGLLYSVKKGWDLVMWQYKKESVNAIVCIHKQQEQMAFQNQSPFQILLPNQFYIYM